MQGSVILKLPPVVGILSLLAACADGPQGGGMTVVHDPAPIVAGTMRPYQERGRWYRPEEQPRYDERGLASWYGDNHHGRQTASGERFDMNALTAAHKTLPLPGLVEVTNLATGQRVVVRINDRGPFVDGRIIDLSRAAADSLGLRGSGVGEVRVRYLGPAPRLGGGMRLQQASAEPPAGAASSSSFWIQAGAFADRDGARRVALQLGERAAVTHDGRLYRVIVGPWPNPNAAEEARQAVIARGYADALLISSR